MRLSAQAGRHLSRPSQISYRFAAAAQISTLPAFGNLRHGQPSQTSSSRGMSCPGTRRFFSLEIAVNTAVDSAESLIMGVHTLTHTPWYISIPLTAVGINLLLRLPGLAHTNRALHTRERVRPLYAAAITRVKTKIAQLPMSRKDKLVLDKKMTTRTFRRLNRLFGMQAWKFLTRPLLLIPVWALVLEALRRMCGGPRGLIGTLLLGPVDPVDAHGSSSQTATQWLYPVADPALTTEGCLWFTDLTQADPYYILPTGVAVLMLMNILPKSAADIRALIIDPPQDRKYLGKSVQTSRPYRAIQRGFLIAGPFLPFLLADLPSALTLYWAASASSALFISNFMLRYKPSSPPAKQKRQRVQEVPMIRPPRP